jgi:hypothetical protein
VIDYLEQKSIKALDLRFNVMYGMKKGSRLTAFLHSNDKNGETINV